MSYLVLARKYRPQNFDELIGQEHIADILKKAVKNDRVAHAYLFTGPRGVGKTSCARILAMCLNCKGGPKVKPDTDDPICREIAKGNSFDVLEIDGASNRGIDEIRALRENVKFAPSYGKFKIYIVDEVHMLTQEAFNALLKTLEEPPEHVKFIFATTAPQKVPSTIISRCQRYDFKRIPVTTIHDQIKDISKKEKFQVDDDALFAIAKAAKGSLRDALSILDQLSALSEKKIHADDVYSMLGIVETQMLFSLADALSEKNCGQSLSVLDEIIDKGKDTKQLTADIIEHFRNLMVIKVGGKSLGRLVDYPVSLKEMLLTQSQRFSLREILLGINLFIEAQETARITEFSRMPLEIAIAKMTYVKEKDTPGVPSVPPATKKKKKSPDSAQTSAAETVSAGNREDDEFYEDGEETEEVPQAGDFSAEETARPSGITLSKIRKVWDSLTYAVSREKMSVATFLQEGMPLEYNEPKLIIAFPENCQFQKETLESSQNVKLVEKVFAQKLKTTVIVQYTLNEKMEPAAPDEPVVNNVLNTFRGKVVNQWHNDE